jgi:hypothetical protein
VRPESEPEPPGGRLDHAGFLLGTRAKVVIHVMDRPYQAGPGDEDHQRRRVGATRHGQIDRARRWGGEPAPGEEPIDRLQGSGRGTAGSTSRRTL